MTQSFKRYDTYHYTHDYCSVPVTKGRYFKLVISCTYTYVHTVQLNLLAATTNK